MLKLYIVYIGKLSQVCDMTNLVYEMQCRIRKCRQDRASNLRGEGILVLCMCPEGEVSM